MALIKNGKIVDDPYVDVSNAETLDKDAGIIVSLEQWRQSREELSARTAPLGIRLRSAESPEEIAEDIDEFSLIVLEFPAFRDGRAYSYARLIRERYGFKGELRAVGDVLMDQLHFMIRTGFDAFEIHGDEPLKAYETAVEDFSVWYQPTGDGRSIARHLRR